MAHLTEATYRQPFARPNHIKQFMLFIAGVAIALVAGYYVHHIIVPMLQAPRAEVVAVEGGIDLVTAKWRFSESELVAEGEQVTLTLTNEDLAPHTFTIDELGVNLVVAPNSAQQVTFEAPAGTYDFYCAAPGHLAVGMKGILTVRR